MLLNVLDIQKDIVQLVKDKEMELGETHRINCPLVVSAS